MRIKNIFTDHPHSVNETYFEHLCFAGLFGFKMLIAGLASILHAFFPFIFKTTGSEIMLRLYTNFTSRRQEARKTNSTRTAS